MLDPSSLGRLFLLDYLVLLAAPTLEVVFKRESLLLVVLCFFTLRNLGRLSCGEEL